MTTKKTNTFCWKWKRNYLLARQSYWTWKSNGRSKDLTKMKITCECFWAIIMLSLQEPDLEWRLFVSTAKFIKSKRKEVVWNSIPLWVFRKKHIVARNFKPQRENSSWFNVTLNSVILSCVDLTLETVILSWLIVTLKTVILSWLNVTLNSVILSWVDLTLRTTILTWQILTTTICILDQT